MLIIFLALAAVPLPAAGSAVGIWEGRVANLPVRACFDEGPSGVFGAYYYLSSRKLIALEAEDEGIGRFRERAQDSPAKPPVWQILSANPQRLDARWSGGGVSHQIRLNRIATRGDLDPCVHILFHEPRLEGVSVSERVEIREGTELRWLTLDPKGRFQASLQTFALSGDDPATRRINTWLGQDLSGEPPNWFDCVRAPLRNWPQEGDYDRAIEPVLITGRWLSVVDRHDISCGGAHPSNGRTYRLFDRSNGDEVYLKDWLGPQAVAKDAEGSEDDSAALLIPAFRDMLLAGWASGSDECADIVRSQDRWTIGLTRSGMVFSPELAHAVRACGEDFIVPFVRIRPYLNRAAEAHVARLSR